MNNAQRGMCFAEWKKCWDAILLATDGTFSLEEKEARAAITMKAIGVAKSWGDIWTQKQIDHLLAIIWATTQGGNFELQFRQQNQALTRAEGSGFAQAYLDAIRDAAGAAGDQELAGRLRSSAGRESYLSGIAKRIHKVPLCDIDDAQWGDVLAALNHTRLHKEGVHHTHPRSEWQKPKSQRTAAAGRAPASYAPSSMAPAVPAPARTGSIVPQGDGEELF